VLNERYNPRGGSIPTDRFLPVEDEQHDLVALFSVFSHMRIRDIRTYLHEIRRAVSPAGKVFLTLFAEDGVPLEEENPEGYTGRTWSGRLHCVRVNRGQFEGDLSDDGFRIDHFDHARGIDGQSIYVLAPDGPPGVRSS
jgi:hypothetical protein